MSIVQRSLSSDLVNFDPCLSGTLPPSLPLPSRGQVEVQANKLNCNYKCKTRSIKGPGGGRGPPDKVGNKC